MPLLDLSRRLHHAGESGGFCADHKPAIPTWDAPSWGRLDRAPRRRPGRPGERFVAKPAVRSRPAGVRKHRPRHARAAQIAMILGQRCRRSQAVAVSGASHAGGGYDATCRALPRPSQWVVNAGLTSAGSIYSERHDVYSPRRDPHRGLPALRVLLPQDLPVPTVQRWLHHNNLKATNFTGADSGPGRRSVTIP